MNEKDDLFVYDEDDSVRFIRNYLPQELKDRFSDDDINYIVDLIYDFYESKGYLGEEDAADNESDVEIDEDELIDYVIKNAKKDGVGKFEADEIAFVVRGELEYCDSLDVFE
jgi:hypothetical protein